MPARTFVCHSHMLEGKSVRTRRGVYTLLAIAEGAREDQPPNAGRQWRKDVVGDEYAAFQIQPLSGICASAGTMQFVSTLACEGDMRLRTLPAVRKKDTWTVDIRDA